MSEKQTSNTEKEEEKEIRDPATGETYTQNDILTVLYFRPPVTAFVYDHLRRMLLQNPVYDAELDNILTRLEAEIRAETGLQGLHRNKRVSIPILSENEREAIQTVFSVNTNSPYQRVCELILCQLETI